MNARVAATFVMALVLAHPRGGESQERGPAYTEMRLENGRTYSKDTWDGMSDRERRDAMRAAELAAAKKKKTKAKAEREAKADDAS